MEPNIYFILKCFKKITVAVMFFLCFCFIYAKDLQVFFNAPPKSNGIDKKLIELIDSAKKTVYCHFYQVNRQNIIDSFVRAAKRLGPKNVGFITDNQYYEKGNYKKGYSKLENAGIKIITDGINSSGSAQSHNKFCVVDHRFVWTGSYNITDNGTQFNNNNAVLIDSKQVAIAYEKEFYEMYRDHLFGKRKSDNINHHFTLESGIPIEVYMAPTDHVESEIVKEIKDANYSIYFVMFTFSNKKIIKAIQKKIDSGIVSKGYLDNLQAKRKYSINRIIAPDYLEAKWDNSTAMVHDKFMVIDPATNSNPTVITGSYNFTQSAEKRNDENIVIIHDKDIANLYYREFIKLFYKKSALPPCKNTVIKILSFNETSLKIKILNDGYNGQGVDLSNLVVCDPFPIYSFPGDFWLSTGQTVILDDKVESKLSSNHFTLPISQIGKINVNKLKVFFPSLGTVEQ